MKSGSVQARLTRRYRFSASHRLHSAGLSEEENYALYGKCNNPFGHGHNYVLDVTVAGPVDSITGCVVERRRLDRVVDSHIVEVYDHRYLNQELPEFAAQNPTAENIALAIEDRLRQCWEAEFKEGSPRLDRIRVEETKRNIVELESSI